MPKFPDKLFSPPAIQLLKLDWLKRKAIFPFLRQPLGKVSLMFLTAASVFLINSFSVFCAFV
jgi:hypothetical protein